MSGSPADWSGMRGSEPGPLDVARSLEYSSSKVTWIESFHGPQDYLLCQEGQKQLVICKTWTGICQLIDYLVQVPILFAVGRSELCVLPLSLTVTYCQPHVLWHEVISPSPPSVVSCRNCWCFKCQYYKLCRLLQSVLHPFVNGFPEIVEMEPKHMESVVLLFSFILTLSFREKSGLVSPASEWEWLLAG